MGVGSAPQTRQPQEETSASGEGSGSPAGLLAPGERRSRHLWPLCVCAHLSPGARMPGPPVSTFVQRSLLPSPASREGAPGRCPCPPRVPACQTHGCSPSGKAGHGGDDEGFLWGRQMRQQGDSLFLGSVSKGSFLGSRVQPQGRGVPPDLTALHSAVP